MQTCWHVFMVELHSSKSRKCSTYNSINLIIIFYALIHHCMSGHLYPGRSLCHSHMCSCQWCSDIYAHTGQFPECIHQYLYVIVIDQLPRFVCSIETQIPRARPEGWVLLYCIQSEGLVNKYFLAHCFHGYNKHVFSPQELYECLPWPSGTV